MIDNPGNPLVIELIAKHDVLSPYKLSYNDFYLNEYESVSDYNIFISSRITDNNIGISDKQSFDKITRDLPEITEEVKKGKHMEDSSIYYATIIYEKDIYFYSRSYKKIQDLLGSIVGIMKLIGFGIGYLSSAFSKLKLKEFPAICV